MKTRFPTWITTGRLMAWIMAACLGGVACADTDSPTGSPDVTRIEVTLDAGGPSWDQEAVQRMFADGRDGPIQIVIKRSDGSVVAELEGSSLADVRAKSVRLRSVSLPRRPSITAEEWESLSAEEQNRRIAEGRRRVEAEMKRLREFKERLERKRTNEER